MSALCMSKKPRTAVRKHVVVIADWDADGATSAAMIVYAQEYRHLYPLRGRYEVYAYPSGPRGFQDTLIEAVADSCPDVVAILDIPLTERVYSALVSFSRECGSTRLVYIDHHYSTLYSMEKLNKLVEELYIGHKPTALLTYDVLSSLGLKRLTPRLQAFMNAVSVLEKTRKPAPHEESVVKLAASISKASTVLRDRELWTKLVRWLASPLPMQTPFDMKVIEQVIRVAEESDREIEEKAKELAMSAKRIGFMKFVDARRKWRGRGASALASKLFKILRQPVALLVERDDGVRLLIIRSRGMKAYKIAVGLLEKGVAENIGGHSSLAVVRLRDGVEPEILEPLLRRLSFEVEREVRAR